MDLTKKQCIPCEGSIPALTVFEEDKYKKEVISWELLRGNPHKLKKEFSFKDFKGAMNYYNSTLSLPLYPSLVKEDLIFICSKIKEIVNSL